MPFAESKIYTKNKTGYKLIYFWWIIFANFHTAIFITQ